MSHFKTLQTFVFVFALISLPAFSEEGELEASSWVTDLNAALNITDGNSETTTLNLGAHTQWEQGPHEFTAEANYNYGESAKRDPEGTKTTSTTIDNLSFDSQYNHLFTERVYALITLSALKDELADINYRVISGPGLGVYLVKEENWFLRVEAGVAYLVEEVADDKSDYATGRVAQRFERELGENALVWQSLEYLPEFGDLENYLLNTEIGARAKLKGNLSLRMVLQSRYDNTPAQNLERNDLTFLAGISYRL